MFNLKLNKKDNFKLNSLNNKTSFNLNLNNRVKFGISIIFESVKRLFRKVSPSTSETFEIVGRMKARFTIDVPSQFTISTIFSRLRLKTFVTLISDANIENLIAKARIRGLVDSVSTDIEEIISRVKAGLKVVEESSLNLETIGRIKARVAISSATISTIQVACGFFSGYIFRVLDPKTFSQMDTLTFDDLE